MSTIQPLRSLSSVPFVTHKPKDGPRSVVRQITSLNLAIARPARVCTSRKAAQTSTGVSVAIAVVVLSSSPVAVVVHIIGGSPVRTRSSAAHARHASVARALLHHSHIRPVLVWRRGAGPDRHARAEQRTALGATTLEVRHQRHIAATLRIRENVLQHTASEREAHNSRIAIIPSLGTHLGPSRCCPRRESPRDRCTDQDFQRAGRDNRVAWASCTPDTRDRCACAARAHGGERCDPLVWPVRVKTRRSTSRLQYSLVSFAILLARLRPKTIAQSSRFESNSSLREGRTCHLRLLSSGFSPLSTR